MLDRTERVCLCVCMVMRESASIYDVPLCLCLHKRETERSNSAKANKLESKLKFIFFPAKRQKQSKQMLLFIKEFQKSFFSVETQFSI